VRPLSPVSLGEFPQNPARPFGGVGVRGGTHTSDRQVGQMPHLSQVRQMPHLLVARRHEPQRGGGVVLLSLADRRCGSQVRPFLGWFLGWFFGVADRTK